MQCACRRSLESGQPVAASTAADHSTSTASSHGGMLKTDKVEMHTHGTNGQMRALQNRPVAKSERRQPQCKAPTEVYYPKVWLAPQNKAANSIPRPRPLVDTNFHLLLPAAAAGVLLWLVHQLATLLLSSTTACEGGTIKFQGSSRVSTPSTPHSCSLTTKLSHARGMASRFQARSVTMSPLPPATPTPLTNITASAHDEQLQSKKLSRRR